MEQEDILSGLVQEMRRGTIILSVLSQLDKPMYGYNLVETLSKTGIAVEANTLYPLLRRLETQGLLTSQWETGGTKPRKYYATTEMGKTIFTKLKRYWNETVSNMKVLLEEQSHEQ